MARARFRAWWEGEEFDEAAAAAAFEQAANDVEPEPTPPEGEPDIFAEEPLELPPRLAALAKLWGEGRVAPGDETAEALEPARLGLEANGVLAVLGPGLVAPLKALAGAHQGEIAAFEWRDETRGTLHEMLKRANLSRIVPAPLDLDTWAPAAETYDGILSLDEFTYAANAPRLAVQIAKALKPGACAVIETYCAVPTPALPPAFAASFAEPQLRPAGDIAEVLTDAGLTVEANEDLSAEHGELARNGFKRLEAALAEAVGEGLDPNVMREIAWEAEAWRERLKLLAQKRLERRRLIVRKAAAS
ncbi:MAG: hypothetical protein AB7T08_00260 [Hyphomonadaceae bacterium]